VDHGIQLTVCNEDVVLLPTRAVAWPAQKTLLVADLHWGKTETFRAHGIALPDGCFESDLQRLSATLNATNSQRLIILGDLVHHHMGITKNVLARIAQWRREFTGEIRLIRGNHDRQPVAPAWNMFEHNHHWSEGPFTFGHVPEPVKGTFLWAGHLHPTVVLRGAGDRLRLPCFHLGRHVGILPAFSEFSGGYNVRKGANERIFAIADQNVIEL